MAKADLLMSFWPHWSPAKSAMQIACLRLPRNCSVFRQDRRSCSVLSHSVISACKSPSERAQMPCPAKSDGKSRIFGPFWQYVTYKTKFDISILMSGTASHYRTVSQRCHTSVLAAYLSAPHLAID